MSGGLAGRPFHARRARKALRFLSKRVRKGSIQRHNIGRGLLFSRIAAPPSPILKEERLSTPYGGSRRFSSSSIRSSPGLAVRQLRNSQARRQSCGRPPLVARSAARDECRFRLRGRRPSAAISEFPSRSSRSNSQAGIGSMSPTQVGGGLDPSTTLRPLPRFTPASRRRIRRLCSRPRFSSSSQSKRRAGAVCRAGPRVLPAPFSRRRSAASLEWRIRMRSSRVHGLVSPGRGQT